METTKRHSLVQELAREHIGSEEGNSSSLLTIDESDSALNPRSNNFNARSWATNIAKVANERGQGFRQVGLCFQKLNVSGYGTPADFQKDVGNIWLALPGIIRRFFFSTAGQTRIDILQDFDGLIRPGEMCVVLGPPGSGCSTFLKTIAGDTNGLYVGEGSYFNYQGISAKEMHTEHRGDAIYTAEVDVHFPHLTVGETLNFAARARCGRDIPEIVTRTQ